MSDLPKVTIYTDGSVFPNPGPGGWGAILICNGLAREVGGRDDDMTNNRAEMLAVITALESLKKPSDVVIYSDSQLVVNGANGEWGRNANTDLWQRFEDAADGHSVVCIWVKGHAGNAGNERAHRLAERLLRGGKLREGYFKVAQLEGLTW